jgi:hypothetical protein
MIFWTLNYTTWELLDPQLHVVSLWVQKFLCGVIDGSEVHVWCN